MKGHFITAGNRDRLYIQSILLLLELEIDCTHNPFLSKGKMITVNLELTEMVSSKEVSSFNGIYL